MTRLRIMHILNSLGLAGTEYGVIKLVNMLDPTRFEPWICSLGGSIPETRQAIRSHVRVVELERSSTGIDWQLPWRLARILSREQIHVIHSHNWSTFAYGVAAARIARVPVVIHGEHGRDAESASVSAQRRLVERLLASRTDHFTAVSRDLCRHIERDWGIPPDGVTFIPNGVDLTRFGVEDPNAELRAQLGFGRQDPLVGTVGEFRPVKDHLTLVRAFVRVHLRVPEARLLLVGFDPEGWFKRILDEEPFDDPGIRKRIHLVGLRTDIPQLMSLLDVYVNSSLYEGMSNTILEAMASRKPVVATAVGGTPDIVEEGITAWLVPPGDSESLAARMIRLLEDPAEARRMGIRGRERVERFHGYATMVESNASIYEKLYAQKVGDRRGAGR